MKKSKKNYSIFEMDFSTVNLYVEDWKKQKNLKANIYRAFSEYILCLQNSLSHENDPIEKDYLEREIKKMKKEQKKYYVLSVLEESKVSFDFSELEKDSLEKSSFSLIKKIKKNNK